MDLICFKSLGLGCLEVKLVVRLVATSLYFFLIMTGEKQSPSLLDDTDSMNSLDSEISSGTSINGM